MSTMPCIRCERSFPEAVLLYGDDGRICAECETEVEDEKAHASKIWSLIVSGPVIGLFGAVLAGLSVVPLLGLLTAVLAPFVGIVTVVQGGRAIVAGAREPNVSSNQKLALFISGALSLLWGLNLLWIGTLLAITHGLAMLTQLG